MNQIQNILMNVCSENSGNKAVKSNTFLRAEEDAQSIKIQFLRYTLNILKRIVCKIKLFDL